MPRLLIRQIMEDTIAILEVLVRRDGMQIVDDEPVLDSLAAALQQQRDFLAHALVQGRSQRDE